MGGRVLLGFALAGCAGVYLKKKGKDVFMKLLLQGVQFMSFERWFLTVSLQLCSLCSEN